MIQRATRVFAAATVLITAASARAQVWEGCVALGAPIASVMDATLGDIAQATFLSGRPIIRYNPNALSRFSARFRRWAYLHECGHHALGHLLQGPIPFAQEQQADCWAIQKLSELENLDIAEVREVQAQLASFGAGDWMHLPGGQRAINLVSCLAGAGGRPGPARRCRTEVRDEVYRDVEVRFFPQSTPCQHCFQPNPWSPPRCMHPADIVQVPQSVPVMRTRRVPVQICD